MNTEEKSIKYILDSVAKQINFKRFIAWVNQESSALFEGNIIENTVKDYTEETYCDCAKKYKPDYLSILQKINFKVNMIVFLAFLNDEEDLANTTVAEANEAFMQAVKDDVLAHIHDYFNHDNFNEYDL